MTMYDAYIIMQAITLSAVGCFKFLPIPAAVACQQTMSAQRIQEGILIAN